MINWTRVHFRHAMNMAAGSLLVVLAFWMNDGRVSVLMGVSGAFIVGIGSIGWMLDESSGRFWRMHELWEESNARSMDRSEMLAKARAELREERRKQREAYLN